MPTNALFPELDLELPAEPTMGPRREYFAGVALEQSVDKELDYDVPAKLWDEVKLGQRVAVPLGRGNGRAFGYIVDLHRDRRHPKTKPIRALTDPRPLVEGDLLTLARWISRYYVSPLGTVIDSIIPSAVKKQIGLGYLTMVRVALEPGALQDQMEATKAPKRRAILARLLQLREGEEIELVRLAGEAGVKPPTVRKLSKLGVITLRTIPDLPALSLPKAWDGGGAETPLTLTEDQAKALAALKPNLIDNQFEVSLLHGVTGSGKTEVYLQAIAEVVAAGRQAVVLVPEIALTPQTVRRFTRRFERVAILHSGLTAGSRHRYWQQIKAGQADVVVGARSAVFAPVPKLGVIVVDEEHETSYKQDQAPRYNARDVAIKRAQLANCPVILGSATPSLETYAKTSGPGPAARGAAATAAGEPGASTAGAAAPRAAGPGSWNYLPLPTRATDQQLPTIEVVDLRVANRDRPGIHLITPRLEALLEHTMDQKEQAILLLNRRGYANFVFCPSCLEPCSCRFCDATMTYHRSGTANARGATSEEGRHTGQLHCHYCLAVNPLPPKCEACGHKLSLFGLGTQRVEEEIKRKFPELKYERVDSDTMRSGREYEDVLARFGRGEIDVLLGTQMIAKGLDYPNVTLVGVISGDTSLALPDFRASERTFQLVTQVAGRAGRGAKPGRVVLQTFLPDDPSIRFALRQDYKAFADHELPLRREIGYPPYKRLVRIVVRDQDEDKLLKRCDELLSDLAPAAAKDPHVELRGPAPCAINRISGYWRHQILLTAPGPAPLQKVLAAARHRGTFATSDKIAVDVDPVSLL